MHFGGQWGGHNIYIFTHHNMIESNEQKKNSKKQNKNERKKNINNGTSYANLHITLRIFMHQTTGRNSQQ